MTARAVRVHISQEQTAGVNIAADEACPMLCLNDELQPLRLILNAQGELQVPGEKIAVNNLAK
jgi:hypothetical protein